MENLLTNEQRQELLNRARAAREKAYAPYSHYKVGAALLTRSGQYFTGCNIENAAYPSGLCAERVAIFKAVSEGEREFIAMAVVTSNGGMPCGGCRQVMAEFGLDTLVLIADTQGERVQEITVSDLLPGAFGPQSLG
ncbi:MAG: cytidine deaminase [Anaerolineales bacterium]|nr:cytidine deaminase [Anaerolineales bacterium]